ncbi:MAG: hypothetical protein AAGE03_12465 [Pseudomonadota bacterium]
MLFQRLMTGVLAASFWGMPLAAQTPVPDQWTSIVPEGAMGQVIAMHLSSASPELSVSMICSAPAPWLEIGLNDQFLRDTRPDIQADDMVVFRAGGVSHVMEPYDEARAWERTQRNVDRKWLGQDTFIAALFAGQPLEILVGPESDARPLRLIGALAGQPDDPGLAQVLAQCGDGPAAPGAVQPIPEERQTWVGDWQLRARGENFPMPVAQVVTMENGSALGLFCDEAGQPAAYFSGAPGDTGLVVSTIGAQVFSFDAVRYADHMVFAVSREFLAALRAGREATIGVEGHFSVTLSLIGSSAGIDHAYAGCAAPAL